MPAVLLFLSPVTARHGVAGARGCTLLPLPLPSLRCLPSPPPHRWADSFCPLLEGLLGLRGLLPGSTRLQTSASGSRSCAVRLAGKLPAAPCPFPVLRNCSSRAAGARLQW